MSGDDLKQMVDALWLTDDLIWDLSLYWIFLLNVALLVAQPEGSAFGTALSIVVIISVLMDKTYAFGYVMDPGKYTPEDYHAKIFIGTYMLRAAMFTAPLIMAGSTESGGVRALGILAGVSGAVYMFARWYFDQQDVDVSEIAFLYREWLPQTTGMVLVLARLALRLGRVHRDVPVLVAGDLAAHDAEVEVA
jgi:hypothetical protein